MYARCHLCCGRGHPAGIRYLQQSKSYVAHGFQTLARRHRLAAADHVISEKDASWPLIAEVSCLSRSDECPPPQHLACQGIALWECLIRTFRVDRSPFVDQQAHVDRRQDSACGRQQRQRLLVVSPAQNLVAQAVSCRRMAPRRLSLYRSIARLLVDA
jgi:hypothetical protein